MQKISVLIAAKERTIKLDRLLKSIERQSYPKDKIEVIVTTEGDPESAKAIGLKKSTGEIICIVASDCELVWAGTFFEASQQIEGLGGLTKKVGAYSIRYHYDLNDPILNRYFALFGCNDPIPFYLGKCDRYPYYKDIKDIPRFNFPDKIPTLGDNGFFIRKDILEKADIKHYSHIDVCEDIRKLGYYNYGALVFDIHHKTGDSIWLWARKRLHYANTLNTNRRWKMISNARDVIFLLIFVLLALTIVEPTLRSIYGYLKSGKRDIAWFMHPIVCFLTVFIYIPYAIRRLCVRT